MVDIVDGEGHFLVCTNPTVLATAKNDRTIYRHLCVDATTRTAPHSRQTETLQSAAWLHLTRVATPPPLPMMEMPMKGICSYLRDDVSDFVLDDNTAKDRFVVVAH